MINLPPDLLAELAAEIDNVVAVKQANDDELGPIEGLDVLAGNDDVFLRTLEFGGAGGILVASHLVGPRDARRSTTRRPAGERERGARDRRRARRRSTRRWPSTANPIPVKAALEMLGVIAGATCGCRWSRPPTTSARRSGRRSRRRA